MNEKFEGIIGSVKQFFDGGEKFSMGYLTAEMWPKHFNGIMPGIVSWQVEQDHPTGLSSNHRLKLISLMSRGIIPTNINGLTYGEGGL